MPLGGKIVLSDLSLGMLLIFALSSISVYAILMSGWSSNSKYAFFGSIRAAAQMISYEVCIGLIMLSVVICAGELNLTKIVQNGKIVFVFMQNHAFFVFVSFCMQSCAYEFGLFLFSHS